MEKTLLIFLVFAFCSLDLGDNCPWPNGTDKAFHWWEEPNSYFTVYDAQIFDDNGNPEYPVNLLEQLYVTINFTYTGPVINNLVMSEDIAEWGGITNCQWSDFPTFGLLDNLNVCELSVQCPLNPGTNQIMKFYMDFTNYQLIVKYLRNDTPYQITYTLKNTDTGNTLVLYAQARYDTRPSTTSTPIILPPSTTTYNYYEMIGTTKSINGSGTDEPSTVPITTNIPDETTHVPTTTTSTTTDPIKSKNRLWLIFLCVGLFLFIFTAIMLIYCILRYRAKRRSELIDKMAREMTVQPVIKREPRKSDNFWVEEKRLKVNYEESLGTGFSSNVYVGKLFGASALVSLNTKTTKFRDCKVAIKIANEYGNNESAILKSEIETMKKVGYHDHIVSMLGWSFKQNKPCLVLELCEGNLLNYVKENREILFKSLISILWQIVQGMEYLVSKRLVHRDLAARNILLIEKSTVKITDFGLCCACDDATLSYQASLQKKLPMRWLSIEALIHRTFSEKSDVWAFGILMHEVFSDGKVPYATMQADEILEFLKNAKRLECPGKANDEVYEIMCSCWEENVETRISFSELSTKLRLILLSETQDYGYICGEEE